MINKGTVLRLSVDHIKELQEQVMHYQQRINDLEQIIHQGKLVNYGQQQPPYHPSSIQPQSIQLLDSNDKDHRGIRSQPSFQPSHHAFGALTSNQF